MMKKTLSIFLTAFLALMVLSACGAKSQSDVLDSLEERMEEMTGYKAEAKMTLNTGEKPLTYDLEIWHKKPDFYRVSLKNAEKDQSQMILRNKDGVFVLTPALNKSFRFQSDWPENNSQVYLFQSLIADILNDSDRGFKSKDSSYVFHTKTNYQNKNLYQQEITLNKNLNPKQVRIMDQDQKELVRLDFSNVKFNAKFDKNAFDMETNMSSAQFEIPTFSGSDEEFEAMYPTYTANLNLVNEREVALGKDDSKVVLNYADEESDKSFTLMQQKNQSVETAARLTMPNGEPVELGFAVGAMTEQSVTWNYEGVDYFLASNNLSQEELMAIARSVYGHAVK
jgi:outer membrane lipoprotein-sorting protein